MYPTYTISNLEEWLQKDKQIALKKNLENFLDDIKELVEKGHLHKFSPDKYFFIKLLHDSNETLRSHFESFIEKKMHKKDFREQLDAFMAQQGLPQHDPRVSRDLVSRYLSYGLLTKIIFYLTIRKRFSQLPNLVKDAEKTASIGKLLGTSFEEARKIDWLAVFEPDNKLDKLGIPKSCEDELRDLLKSLDEYNFAQLKEDVIGEIFEYLIPEDQKHKFGQYFTREDLVDLIIGFSVQSPKGHFSDPTCGSGTFLNRLYSRIKYLSSYSRAHEDLIEQLWGFDIAKFPAELATINLFRQDITNYKNFPRIRVTDFFDVHPGKEYEFPPPKMTPGSIKRIKVKVPKFDGMVGNFPFIRQEQIEKRIVGYKQKVTLTLADEWKEQYPDLFNFKKKSVEIRLSGQADIYAYLFIHGASFLENGGRMGFITSNSYLDVSYGHALKKFFLDNFKIVAIVCSWVEPWFDFASVNTVFTIVERCSNKIERENHFVKFVKLKKKLEHLIPYRDLELEESDRWNHIDKLVNTIENCERKSKKISEEIKSFENEDFRVRSVEQRYLNNELTQEREHSKWGKYLRGPDVYFEILEQAKGDFQPLRNVRRGYTTGINDFFYLQPTDQVATSKNSINVKNKRDWSGDIEKQFLKPVIKSPKESNTIRINSKKLRNLLFVCDLQKKQLRKNGLRGALKYIEWGEKQKTKIGAKWTEVPSVIGRDNWWSLREKEPRKILMQMVNNDRFLIFLNSDKVHADHNFFEFELDTEIIDNVAAVLNSTFTALNRELISRVNLGDGATKTEGIDWSNNVLLFDHSQISKANQKKILNAFEKIMNRPIESIHKEIKKPDRIKLDKLILEAFGLNPAEVLPKIYEGITELVRERLALPKMRKRIVQARFEFSRDEVKHQVEEEILQGGLKQFPEAFQIGIPKSKLKEITTTGKRLMIGSHFFGEYEVVDEEGQKVYMAESLEVARFLVCSFDSNEYIIQIPKSKIEITKAITKYEKYIKETYEKLIRRAYSATQDHNMAEQIAIEILLENGYSEDFELF